MGNNATPTLSFLSISEGGLDCIMYLYKKVLPFLNGYITENGDID